MTLCVDPERGAGGLDPPSPKNKKKSCKILSNLDPDFQENHNAINPAFNVGLTLGRQHNAILMAVHWWVEDGILIFMSRINIMLS